MAVAWPSGVPTCVRAPQGDVQDARVLFEPEVGQPIDRPRTTLVQVQMQLAFYSWTLAEFAIFEDWWRDDVANGTANFVLPDPIKGDAAIWSFLGPYSYREALRGRRVAVSFNALRLRFQ